MHMLTFNEFLQP